MIDRKTHYALHIRMEAVEVVAREDGREQSVQKSFWRYVDCKPSELRAEVDAIITMHPDGCGLEQIVKL